MAPSSPPRSSGNPPASRVWQPRAHANAVRVEHDRAIRGEMSGRSRQYTAACPCVAHPAHPYAGARAHYPQACSMERVVSAHAWARSGPTTPEAHATERAGLHPPSLTRQLSHHQTPHERAPSSSTRDATLQAAPVHHLSNLTSCGAEGRAARRVKEKGGACSATILREARERSRTSATNAQRSAPQARACVEHAVALTCDVQHS